MHSTRRAWMLPLALLALPGRSLAQDGEKEASPSAEGPAHDKGDLARQTQNPGAALLSVPFQLNFNGDIGPDDRTQTLLNIQPVLPVEFSEHYSLITRWILPLMAQPDVTDATETTWGVGDLNPQLFLAANYAPWTLGLGVSMILPTATTASLGQGKLSVGPAVLAVFSEGDWVVGALATFAASVAGNPDREDVRLTTVQPFINFNLPDGAYLVTAPLLTHEAETDQTTVPLGGGVGKLFVLGKTPVNFNVQAYGNVEHPDGGPTWQMRMVAQFLFPQPAGGKAAQRN